jgi:hypothetical protein
MRRKEWMTDLKFRILCILADNRGHIANEIQEILDIYYKKRNEEYNPHRPMELIYSKKTFKILGIVAAKPRKQKIYKSNLNDELKELKAANYIYRTQREKQKERKRYGNLRGPNTEFVYYIEQDKYSYLDKTLLHELKVSQMHFGADMRGKTKKVDMKNIDGSTSTVIAPFVDTSESSPIYHKCLRRFYQWNRSKNPEIFDKYIEAALGSAEYRVGNYQMYHASIPAIPEIPETLGVCIKQLKPNLEDWISLELSLGLSMPQINGISLKLPIQPTGLN